MNIATCKTRLEAKRRALAGHLRDVEGRLAGAIPIGVASQTAEWRGGGVLNHVKMDALRRIDVALARLREGSYGFCQICGEDIEDARLDHCPATPFCCSCDR